MVKRDLFYRTVGGSRYSHTQIWCSCGVTLPECTVDTADELWMDHLRAEAYRLMQPWDTQLTLIGNMYTCGICACLTLDPNGHADWHCAEGAL